MNACVIFACDACSSTVSRIFVSGFCEVSETPKRRFHIHTHPPRPQSLIGHSARASSRIETTPRFGFVFRPRASRAVVLAGILPPLSFSPPRRSRSRHARGDGLLLFFATLPIRRFSALGDKKQYRTFPFPLPTLHCDALRGLALSKTPSRAAPDGVRRAVIARHAAIGA